MPCGVGLTHLLSYTGVQVGALSGNPSNRQNAHFPDLTLSLAFLCTQLWGSSLHFPRWQLTYLKYQSNDGQGNRRPSYF